MKKLLTLLMAVVALLASPGATAAPTNDEINAAILAEGQSALTWENDPIYPWTVVDGVMQSSNAGHPNTESRLTAKLKLDRPTRIEYSYSHAHNTSYMALTLYVDDKKVRKHTNQSSDKWYNDVIVLPAGEHTLSWQCDINDYDWDSFYYRLKEVKVAQDWIEVNSTAGTLGDEVLKKTDILQNVRMLKVTGAMNSTDWDKIALMTNLNAIDLSETNIEDIIENAFKNNPLKYVGLPKNTKTIRQSAFYKKDIYSVDLPSSVTTIERNAFESSSLVEINISDNTSLTSIGESAFYGTNLTRFLMPNTVTSLGSSAFSDCTSLTELTFSENITSIPSSCCLYNKNITKLKIPTKVTSIGRSAFQDLSIDSIVLPKKLVDLGESAFSGCDSLRYVEIPTGIHNLYYAFYNCKNIETIICKSPTPPTISQPFNDKIQSTATLRIPEFAMDAYLQDSYWYKFKNIEVCNAEDYWAVGSQLTLAEGQRMEGTPDLNIFSGASVTINGNQAANFNSVTFNTDGGYYYNSKSGVLINNCPNATAKSAVLKMTIKKDRWYFITPLFDIARANITAEGIHNIAIREYDAANRATNGTGDNWKNIGNNDMKAGHGYIIRCGENGTLTFTGNQAAATNVMKTGVRSVALNNHESTSVSDSHWNYIGNPYPCYFDIRFLEVGAPITIRNDNSNRYEALSTIDDSYVLNPMEGFFVQKPVENTTGAVFALGGRLKSRDQAKSSNAPALPDDNARKNRHVFNIEILEKNGDNTDRTRVVINESASLDYEISCDAAKFMSDNKDVAHIYTVDNENNHLAINERPLSDGYVDLEIVTGNSAEYVIRATRTDGEIRLIDNTDGSSTDLTSDEYILYAQPNSTISGRYRLMFKPGESGVENIAATGVKAVAGKGYIEVSNPACSKIAIYSADGKMRLMTEDADFRLQTEAGIYVLRTHDKAYKLIVK